MFRNLFKILINKKEKHHMVVCAKADHGSHRLLARVGTLSTVVSAP